jgi:AraC-like DNA-binding protein
MSAPLIRPDQASALQGPAITAVAAGTGAIRVTEQHRHARGQLLGATTGLLSVDAGEHRWVVPATHAVWVPPEVSHGVRSHGPFAGWSVYVIAPACAALPATPCVLPISDLLRAAITRAATWSCEVLDAAQSRLADVMLDEINAAPQVPLGLPMPRDARLVRIARALSARPGDERDLQDWASWAGIAARSLSRRFSAETGFSFAQWRQRLRLLHALELLASGRQVAAVALDVGYDNVSAFIALFKRTTGMTPGRYQDAMRRAAGRRLKKRRPVTSALSAQRSTDSDTVKVRGAASTR